MSESRATATPSQTSSSPFRSNTKNPPQNRQLAGQGFAASSEPNAVLQLQRQLGNQGMQALWGSGRLQRLFGLQRQLTVGAVDDPLEHEANRAADEVMEMPAPGADGPEMQMQRACADCKEEMQQKPVISRMSDSERDDLQMQRKLGGMDGDASESLGYTHAFEKMDDEEDLGTTTSLYMKRAQPPARLQRDANSTNAGAAASGAGGPVSPDLAADINSLRSRGGSPLGNAERNFFEPRFGRDFSDVRVHAGPDAAKIARQVNARAFTIGRDVVFGAGEYRPDTNDGRRLMAHELTHTVQQGAAGKTLAAKPVLQRQTMLRRERNEQPAPRKQSETEQFIRSVAAEALPILLGRQMLLPLHFYLRAMGLKMNGIGVGLNLTSGAALGAYAQTNVISYGIYGIKEDEIGDAAFYTPELGAGLTAGWDGIGIGAVVSLIYTKDPSQKALIKALGGTSVLAQIGVDAMVGFEVQASVGKDLFFGEPGAVSFGVTVSGGGGGGGAAIGVSFAEKLKSSVDKLNIPGFSSDRPGLTDMMESDHSYAQLVRAALNTKRLSPGRFPGVAQAFNDILRLLVSIWAYSRPMYIAEFSNRMRIPLRSLGVPFGVLLTAQQSLTKIGWGSRIFPEGNIDYSDFVAYTPVTLLKPLLKSQVVELKGDLCDAAQADAKMLKENFNSFIMAGNCSILTIEDVESN